MLRYENEDYEVDEINNIDEIIYFQAEDFKTLENINNENEEFKVNEIQKRIVDDTKDFKKNVDKSFGDKINNFKTSIKSISSTVLTTSMAAVAAVIGVETIIPDIFNNPSVVNYGDVEFLNYFLDYDETSKLNLMFSDELDDGYYCVVVNTKTNEAIELEDGKVTFEGLDYDSQQFEVKIYSEENEILSNETLNIDLSNKYLGLGTFDYTITYNEDNTTNLYILLDNMDKYNSYDLYLANENLLSYEPIIDDNVVVFENIIEDKFTLKGKSYYEDLNTYTIYNYFYEVDLDYDLNLDVIAKLNELTIVSPIEIEGDLKLVVEYLDTGKTEEILIDSSKISDEAIYVELSRIVEEYNLTIEGNFYVSNPHDNIDVNKGHYYRKYTYCEVINPILYSYVNLEKIEILNDSYSEMYTEELYGTPTKVYFDGYLLEGELLAVNVYNADKTLLLDSIDNINSLDEYISFYDLDTTQDLVFEYIIYQDEKEILKEEYNFKLSNLSDYSNLDYNINHINPNDVYITYNDDGTYNAYFNMGFINNTEYDLEYKIELIGYGDYGEKTFYQYQGSDNVAVICNINPEISYGLEYSMYVKDGINYYAIADKLVPSGTVECYVINEVYECEISFEETVENGVYESNIYYVVREDVEIKVLLDGLESINILIPYDKVEFEYNDLGYKNSTIITLDLSSYTFETAEIIIITSANPYLGLGNQIKESGIEIVGKDYCTIIYNSTILK